MNNLVLYMIIDEPEVKEKEKKNALQVMLSLECLQRHDVYNLGRHQSEIWVPHIISPMTTQAFMILSTSMDWYRAAQPVCPVNNI